jgi:nicotinamidase-related amidase
MTKPKPVDGALLLCLDLQPVFLRAVAGGTGVQRRCEFAIAAARGLGIPVAFTEQAPWKLGGTEAALLAMVEEPEIHSKETFSALAAGSPCRVSITEGRHIEHLILAGVETPICVFQTAVDAIQAGLAVTVLTDCVGARREEDSRSCLQALARAGAHILPAETVFYSILAGSAHPFFKEFTELVKKYG